MTTNFDQNGINHMTTAISREMTPQRRARHADADTIFMGGPPPSDADQTELAMFGLRKNYKIIFPSFDPADVARGPVGYHAVVTDGLAETVILSGGRLWKRDRRSEAVLLFPDLKAVVKLSAKGRLVVRAMAGQYHDHGYDLARESITPGAARKPGNAPVVSAIGSLVTVLDLKTLGGMFAAA